ncbi:MAG: GMC family oxidoreductase [Pseudomonadota bacterium]
MIIDGRKTDDVPDTAYDVVIVGAGPAGISLAHELRDTGLRIALLESGGREFDGDVQALNDGRLEGNENYDLGGSRLRFLGGTSNHWGGQCTPLDPLDFERAPPGYSGWPMRYEEMVPYWQRAHAYCDVGAYRYDPSELAPDDPDLWLMPDAPELDTVVLRQSTPTRFGEKYHDMLAASETVHLWLWATAVAVSTAPGASEETVTIRRFDGSDLRFTARAVVLAGGAIEATRLLQWSNAENGTSAGGALLGRCYMDHLAGGVGFLHFDKKVGEKIYWNGIGTYPDEGVDLHFGLRLSAEVLAAENLSNAIFHAIPVSGDRASRQRSRRATDAYRSMHSLARWALGRSESQFDPAEAYCTLTENVDDFVVDSAVKMVSSGTYSQALIRFEAEERPGPNSFVALDPDARDALGVPRPVLTWAPSEDDIDDVRRAAVLLGRIAGANGVGRVELENHDDKPYWNVATAWHQLGTMRMAASPTAGVTDPDGRVHGAGALYVASGATFPTGGRANPTLTIVALAIRLGDHLKERMSA